jgi:hypothetical protein
MITTTKLIGYGHRVSQKVLYLPQTPIDLPISCSRNNAMSKYIVLLRVIPSLYASC